MSKNIFAVDGNEAMMYDMFVKLYGTREKTNDILNPRYSVIGDIMLPRGSVIHYQQHTPGEVGPSNTSPFISNFDKRINIYFNEHYAAPLGVIKIENVQLSAIIKRYEGSHFVYTRTRNYQTVITKDNELLVNNLAIGQVPVVYRRRTVFTPFQQKYNDMATLVENLNNFSKFNKHQFVEIPLPRSFPSYKALELNFAKYKKFFNEDYEIVRYDKVPLAPFQAEQSFWLFDLFGILMGHDEAKYSIFSKLSEQAREQMEIIFTYNGKCWIVNLQNVINLLSYSDKPEETTPSSLRINYFKRFYLSLINLVTPIIEIPERGDEDGSEEEGSDNTGPNTGSSTGRPVDDSKKEKGVPVESSPVVDNPSGNSLADLYSSTKGTTTVPDDSSRNKGKETDNASPGTEPDDRTLAESESDPVDQDSWGADIADEVFERVNVESATVVTSTHYSPTAAIERELTEMAKSGQLTSKEKDFFERAANTYKDLEIGGRPIEEIINITKEDMVMKEETLSPDSIVVRDKSSLRSRTEQLTSNYIDNVLNRNIIESILYVQNGKTALVGLDVEPVVTADSKYNVFKMQFQTLNGTRSTRYMRAPIVESDGTFTINGVKAYAQLMRMELPIRKISPTKVALTSYYDKKVMVERSIKRVDDYAVWLRASIIKRSYEDKTLRVNLGGFKSEREKVCYYYSILASRFKSLETSRYLFDFDTTAVVGDNKSWVKLCNNDSWVIGKEGDHPILIDSTGLVTIDGEEKGYIEELLGLNLAKAPIPTATCNINGYKFPVVVLLSYWMGFDRLLEVLKPTYRTVPPEQRPQLSADEYMVQLADERLVFNRRDELTTLVMSGLRKLQNLGNFSRSHLNDPNIWFGLIGDSRVKPSHFKEMSMIYDMFIDPITKRLLEDRKYPVVMDELVIEAVKLLLSNESKHEIEITEQRMVGYERFAGHIYRELVKSTRQYRNKPNGAKKTFDLNPEAVMMNIITDSSCQSVEEVNPVHQLKQQEEVTFGGTMGRSDRAMVRRTRGQLPNYEGVISEAGKDSGKVGFISYLTSDSKIVDLYGNIDVKQKTTNTGRGSVVLNLLYGTTKDDTKRTLFASVQQSQVMAADNYVVNPIRTSYDTMIAYRTSELYSSVAKKDGKITEVTPNGILVEYSDGTEDKFSLGYSVGKGAGEYHKHLKVTDYKVGDTFTKGTVVAWNELYFERDMLDPTRVVWKSGGMARIALIEDQFTFEDSIGITKEFAESSTTPFLKLVDFKVNADQSIKMHVKVGDRVEYDQILCDIEDPVSAVFDYDDADKFDGLERMGIKQKKAKQAGVISRIEVLYNGDIETWDDSLKAFIKKQNGSLAKEAKYKELTATTGNVGGNTSVGKSKVYLNTAVVYIYIENKINTTTADKFVVGNQMKGTVGFIYEDQIRTTDGRKVDITFSLKSLLNRMVLSLRDKIAANEVNNVYTQRIISKHGKF